MFGGEPTDHKSKPELTSLAPPGPHRAPPRASQGLPAAPKRALQRHLGCKNHKNLTGPQVVALVLMNVHQKLLHVFQNMRNK